MDKDGCALGLTREPAFSSYLLFEIVILLTDFHMFILILVLRIWYCSTSFFLYYGLVLSLLLQTP